MISIVTNSATVASVDRALGVLAVFSVIYIALI